MRQRRFIQCDVFTPTPTRGNALAVVVDGEDLNQQEMQQFAAWTNLAETTFVLPPQEPQADYRLKIFSPAREMLFAGHPTLGSCAAWLHAGGIAREPGRVRQECGVGIVEIDCRDPRQFAFAAPPTQIRPINPQTYEAIVARLEIPEERILHSAELENGPLWQAFQLDSAEAVLALDSARVRWPEFKALGFIGAQTADSELDFEVRMLAPSSGMSEDPITGSLNSALAHWLQSLGQLETPKLIAQGTSIGRHGRVAINPEGRQQVWIGGQTHILIDGSLLL